MDDNTPKNDNTDNKTQESNESNPSIPMKSRILDKVGTQTAHGGEPEVTEAEKSSEPQATGEVEQPQMAGSIEESGAQQAGSEAQNEKPEVEKSKPSDALATDEPHQAGESQEELSESAAKAQEMDQPQADDPSGAKWYVVHTYSGHENKVSAAIKQRIESEHLEHKILDVLVPTQDKIEIKAGKKEQVKEKIFPGYILVKMVLDDSSWLAVRTTQGVTSFVGIGNKPTPIPEHEVKTIIRFMSQGATSTFKDVYAVNDTIKIIDGPFSDFIGKVDTVDKEKGKVRVLVSIFGRETPVELDFLQVQKL